MYLIINTTTKQEKIEIILATKVDEFKVKKITGKVYQTEKLLPQIDKFLAAEKISLGKLKGIGVVSGAGSFTAIRIGVAVANALGFALKIPVVGLTVKEYDDNPDLVKKIMTALRTAKTEQYVLPSYDREPNITVGKK